MNIKELKTSEKSFLKKYPGGFLHPEMVEIGKKHKMEQLIKFAKDSFAKNNFNNSSVVTDSFSKIVSRSSMVSMFEKPKFKSMISGCTSKEKTMLSDGLYEVLHGKERMGFEQLVSFLQKNKMGRWPIATVVQSYFRPQKDVFIKPTTTKLIISALDVDLVYHSTPTWDFYKNYRKAIKEMKPRVDQSLSPNNAAFCGFLMMALG